VTYDLIKGGRVNVIQKYGFSRRVGQAYHLCTKLHWDIQWIKHEMVPLLRQSVYACLAGYEDTNDVAKLAKESCYASGGRTLGVGEAGSTNTVSRFKAKVLALGRGF